MLETLDLISSTQEGGERSKAGVDNTLEIAALKIHSG
jgi:hypothetical protein